MSDKGAHFFRCDLQVHSPRDLNWAGDERVAELDRRLYADQLVQACRTKGIQGIAITDHHDMAFVEHVRRSAADETDSQGTPLPVEKQLVVFPGMELTLAVPCQALLIFDASLPQDLFNLAMTALAITPNPPTDSKIAPVERLNIQSLRQLKDHLDKHAYLRERYIVFPNVGENGQFSLIRKGQALKYIEMPCVGGYVDGRIAALGTGNQNIISGKAKEWGNKRIACFQTSDSRSEDHEQLGQHSTWIKWAVPTAEALRQACLAQESRVSQDQPQLPSVTVASISVSNSAFLGPIELDLNSQYTALIGGRGTGKSTILEYLRWALCDQPPDLADDAGPNYQIRRSRLIDQTLKPVSASVQVRFEVNGVPHVVRRGSQDGSLQIKISRDAMRPCTEEEIRALLPIQAYSQKQLSDVSVRVDELSRFITAPIRSDLNRIDRQAAERAERVRQSYSTKRRYIAITQTIQRRELEEKSLSDQADMLRAGLTGLSDEDRQLLSRGKDFEEADRGVQSWRSAVLFTQERAFDLQSTIERYLASEISPTDPEPEILQSVNQEYRSFLTQAKTSIGEIISQAAALTKPLGSMPTDSPWHRWHDRINSFRSAYAAAVSRSSVHSDKMQQLREIEQRLSESAAETDRQREQGRSLTAAEATYSGERAAWEQLLDSRDDLLEGQCRRLTENSGGAIRANMRRYADTGAFVNSLRQFLSGSRIQGNKIEAIGEAISSSGEQKAQWHTVLSELEKLADFDPERYGTDHRPDTPTLSRLGFTASELDRIARCLRAEDWISLSLTPIASRPIFEYRARENEYIPFHNASAGQQATALLKTLLNEPGAPLIIDQPEEDLDNQVILEIVEQVWQAKQKRQILFASHNANLVVNGDAELVVWCDHRTTGDQSRGTIAGEGAIDVPKVRDAIKRIMEGGEAAFSLRKEKYGF